MVGTEATLTVYVDHGGENPLVTIMSQGRVVVHALSVSNAAEAARLGLALTDPAIAFWPVVDCVDG